MIPGKKKYCPEYAEMFDRAQKSMEGRPKDKDRESAKEIMDVYGSREIQKDGPVHSFRGRVSGLKLGSLSRKEWDKMRLDEDMDNLKKGEG